MKIRNLTPHPVMVRGITFPAEGACPRCSVNRTQVDLIRHNGVDIPVTRSIFGAVEGLPAHEAGTILIVSRLVADACPDRGDLYFPDDLVRDSDGKVIGANSLGKV
mgnify:CR=1 FL=1